MTFLQIFNSMIFRVGLDSTTIMMMYLGIAIVCVLPFFIADVVLLHTYESDCLALGLGQLQKPLHWFTLRQWIYNDGYIKIGFVGGAIYFAMMVAESRRKSEIVSAYGNLMTLYWLFEIGWTIVGSVIFWGYPQNLGDIPGLERTFHYCGGSPYYSYMFARLIIYLVLILILLPLSRLRSSQELGSDDLEITVNTRRDTELIPK